MYADNLERFEQRAAEQSRERERLRQRERYREARCELERDDRHRGLHREAQLPFDKGASDNDSDQDQGQGRERERGPELEHW